MSVSKETLEQKQRELKAEQRRRVARLRPLFLEVSRGQRLEPMQLAALAELAGMLSVKGVQATEAAVGMRLGAQGLRPAAQGPRHPTHLMGA